MSATDARARLSKILPLLASDKAGERDAAALAAQRILTKAGLCWDDIIVPAPTPVPQRAPPSRPWRKTCLELQQHQGSLRVWERGFVASLPNFNSISVKQRNILNEIADRVLGGAP